MIIDEVTLTVRAGDGGDGHASFHKEKFISRGGPDGGNGGRGGDVYFLGTSDLSALRQFRYKKIIKALRGGPGRRKKRYGKDGEDTILKIPIGSEVRDLQTNEVLNITTHGEIHLAARGGRGGRGNFEFKSNENKAPTNFEPGFSGEYKEFQISLHFIADVGLIGLPSAGKSSLLNALTSAEVKVGNYPFTTTEANLGDMNGIIIADIPGLIEGAHEGKGLGIKFLKHIEKTKILVHCIDSSSENIVKDYHTVRHELAQFSESLMTKKEIILLTKLDVISESDLKKKLKLFKKYSPDCLTCSIVDDSSIVRLKKLIQSLL